MATFTLTWNNIPLLTSTNVIAQRASYRRRGTTSWITAGFSPSNDMAKTVSTATTPNSLSTNCVYQFKVEAICTSNGPTTVLNGIQEAIIFSCITPLISPAKSECTISLDVSIYDITKAKFTLFDSADNVVDGPVTVNAFSGSIGYTAYNIPPGNYYWTVETFAVVNGVEISSGDLECSHNFVIEEQACSPITNALITAIS